MLIVTKGNGSLVYYKKTEWWDFKIQDIEN